MLTDDNKAFILRKINEGIQDYVVLANLVFNREDLTGRAKEAKTVRDFLISTGFSKKQEKPKPTQTVEILSKENCEFIDQNIKTGITPRQVTELIFHEKFVGVENLNIFITAEYRAVQKYIKEKYPDHLVDNESGVGDKYSVPRSIKTVINKANKWCGQNISEDKLSLQHRKCMEKLLTYLSSPRFVGNYDSYNSSTDKELFEAEFASLDPWWYPKARRSPFRQDPCNAESSSLSESFFRLLGHRPVRGRARHRCKHIGVES